MLASQLCVFDNQTNLKWKWVKKLIVWLCCPNYLVYLWRYRSVLLCRCAMCLMIWCTQSECVMPYLTQELEHLKLSSSTKSATVDKVITKKHKEAVSTVEFLVTK